MEFKEELELLLNNYIITKKDNPNQYYKVKSKIEKIREFTTNKLGCDIICNSLLIKLEKLPSMIDNTFKIDEFNNNKDYILFLLVIMFLEEKSKEEQFILSNLTAYITNTISSINNKKITIDFKDFSIRKGLVDVLKYCVKIGILRQIDGDDELFKDNINAEVLYENTGISRYIIRNFKDEIFDYNSPSDFLKTTDTEDELNMKRYYTYRTLLFYPMYHYNDLPKEVYNYFINYRNRIKIDIGNILDGELIMFNNMAFLTTEEKQYRNTFPNSRKTLSDIILLLNKYLAKDNSDYIIISKLEFKHLLTKLHDENKKYFSKEFREMKIDKFMDVIIKEMKNYKLVVDNNDDYIFSPIVYLISGYYSKEEEEISSLEQISLEVFDV